MRFYPDRTLRIDLKDLTDEWVSLGYSEYCIRRVQGEIEIKHSDDIFDLSDDEPDDDDYDEETDASLDTYAWQGEEQ